MGAAQSISYPYVLSTPKGSLKGLEQRDLSGTPILYRYTRIPYALPPVQQLRWRRPQPLPSSYTFDQSGQPGDYTAFGSVCPQPEYNTDAALVENPDTPPPFGNVPSEDCLYLNIWVPAGTPPEGGWPVQFFIHGGWLQVGVAMQSHDNDPFDLLAHSTKRVIISPTYRLNLFGFAAGKELADAIDEPFAGNFGLWDQRLALEWTYANIGLFGGDRERITVGGLSAGAHSAFLQLYHDAYLPRDKQIVKQIHLYSNALAIQPNPTTSETLTTQFDSLCEAVNIPTSLSAKEKVAKLRAISWEDLIATIPRLRQHTFRTSTDGPIEQGGFVPATFLSSLHDGSFATRIAEKGARILLGEVRDEALLYKLVNPPSSHADLLVQLQNYYPKPVVDALVVLPLYEVPSSDDTSVPSQRWADVFAEIVADGQVHASIRGLTKSLLEPPQSESVKAVPRGNVLRYRICWRAKALDNWLKPEVGLCHASDTPIWWETGFRAGFNDDDKKKCDAFLEPFGRYLNGETDVGWGGDGSVNSVRLLDESGNVHEGWEDELWDRGMVIWDAVWNAQKNQYR